MSRKYQIDESEMVQTVLTCVFLILSYIPAILSLDYLHKTAMILQMISVFGIVCSAIFYIYWSKVDSILNNDHKLQPILVSEQKTPYLFFDTQHHDGNDVY